MRLRRPGPGTARRLAAALLVACAGLAGQAYAQEHREVRAHEHFRSPHMVLDERYHHNHFYPSLGYSIAVLPRGHVAIAFGRNRYFFHMGVWYRTRPHGYVVVRPPLGIVIPVLPPGCAVVWAGSVAYYYANDTYYTRVPGGYAVAAPPAQVVEAPPPPPLYVERPAQAAAPNPGGAGTWYYCESTKSYYPYVLSCSEGWRQVPAAPPPGR